MGEKKVKGRKRQVIVDTSGNLHQVLVHRANIHDSKGGAVLIDLALKKNKAVTTVVADLGYRGLFEEVVKKLHKKTVQFSSKITGHFVIQPIRWVVERTLSWLNNSRRLSKDFEQKCIYSENLIRLSAISLLLKQIH